MIVEEDGGPFGREARFYLINKPVAEVLAIAEPELLKANFKVDSGPVGTSCFQRGKGDRVEIHSGKHTPQGQEIVKSQQGTTS